MAQPSRLRTAVVDLQGFGCANEIRPGRGIIPLPRVTSDKIGHVPTADIGSASKQHETNLWDKCWLKTCL